MAFVYLNVYLDNARKHWRGLVIGIQIWDTMCQRAAAVVNTIQVNARIVFLKNPQNAH